MALTSAERSRGYRDRLKLRAQLGACEAPERVRELQTALGLSRHLAAVLERLLAGHGGRGLGSDGSP
jgi:hypothetical protein